ncbi:MAG: sulfotransferase domain-containing protein [Paracoccaceae bacterium]
MKPTFYIIGAPKCGTTSWAAYLAQHPMVQFSNPKELNHFSTDLRTTHNLIVASDAEYEARFKRPDTVPMAGEATPFYLYSSEAVPRIAAYTPDAKIVILLRESVPFFRSLHQQFLYRRIETEADPRKAWDGSGQRQISGNPDGAALSRHLDYKAIGDFNAQVARVLEHFPPDQVFIAWMEDWKDDPAWLYRELATFLGIDASYPLCFEVHNAAKRHRSATLSRLTIRPSGWVMAMARWVKRLLGLKRLGIAAYLREMNTTRDVSKTLPSDLEAEISAFYRDSIEELNRRSAELGILRRPDRSETRGVT